jgi:hypothetical protein
VRDLRNGDEAYLSVAGGAVNEILGKKRGGVLVRCGGACNVTFAKKRRV